MLSGYKTIIASAIAIVAALLQAFGVEWSLADQQALGTHLVEVISMVSAIYFRVTATKSFATVTGKLE
jgi:hypothetical protein